MPHFIFLLCLCLYVQESKAVRDSGSLDATEEASLAHTNITKPNPQHLPLEKLSKKIQAASQGYDAYAFQSLLEEFNNLEGEEATWKEVAHKQGVERWPSQNSWKIAVGAHLFLRTAINDPHLKLLRNGLRHLLSWTSGEGVLEDVYPEAITTIHKIIQTHPYIHRRTALYALTVAAYLQHPLARLFLTEALRCYESKDACFFSSNHILVKTGLSLEKGREALHHFIDVPDIEAFIDLRAARDLEDPKKLEEKAQLDLPLYNVLLGDYLYAKAQASLPYSNYEVDPVIEQYIIAANRGDFKGCLKASKLMSAIFTQGIKSSQPLDLRDDYLLSSALYGNEEAYMYVHIGDIMDEKRIPGTKEAIFKFVKRFLTPKR